MSSEEKIEKSKRRVKRFVVVARKLATTHEFTASKKLAEETNMEPEKFRASVQRAKELLASHGYMVTNATRDVKNPGKSGYKKANFEEFKAEIHKSCARASANILQALKLVSLIERSGACEHDLEPLKETLKSNIQSITFPQVEKEFLEYSGMKPEFVSDMAEEYVDDDEN